MYTQCPECGTAFRVTAEVLKQAAGKVRCGGCGSAFNALEYLSEQKPVIPAAPETGDAVPELKPDATEVDDGDKPKAISAEQSAALLKTLDQLAGDDVRIEDTGVEWRVLTDGEDDDDDEGSVGDIEDLDDTGSMKWFLDESPTPVDEQLSAEPGKVDAPELFEDSNGSQAAAEMRFDDHTPLPDDFDFDSEPSAPEPMIETRDAPSDIEEAQVDLTLGEPEDWDDLLGEVDDGGIAVTEQRVDIETGAPLADEIPALPDQDETAIGDAVEDEVEATVRAAFEDEPIPDVDKQFDTLAEAMGIDISGIHKKVEEAEFDHEAADALEDSTIDDDLIAAAFEVEAAQKAQDDDAEDVDVIEIDEDDVSEADLELELDDTAVAEIDEAPDADEALEDLEVDTEEHAGEVEDDAGTLAVGDEEFDEIDIELELDEDEDLVEARDRELVVSTEADAKLAAELGLADESADEPEKAEQVVPPMTEEEQTVNMMIDEDLLAIAVTDEEGFTSTIVQKQDAEAIRPTDDEEDDDIHALDAPEDEDFEAEFDDGPEPLEDKFDIQTAAEGQMVETIIMEGEYVRDAEEDEKLEEARRKTGDPNLKSAVAASISGVEEHEEMPARMSVDWRLAASIGALVFLLLIQFLHQSRESLAVYPAFNGTVGAIYRTFGSPVTPSWDITGWRFEATKGETDENDEVLTIYSQIGNKSDEALPYPLINISLTDRFEDVIGSRVLEPTDYLAENLDTRQPVAPGNRFTAVFSIDAPDANATGFKLDVCYRHSGTLLKCAIDDFK